MTSIYYLRSNKEPKQGGLTDKTNSYRLASAVNRQSDGLDYFDTPKTVVVGKQFKPLSKRSNEPAK